MFRTKKGAGPLELTKLCNMFGECRWRLERGYAPKLHVASNCSLLFVFLCVYIGTNAVTGPSEGGH